MIDNKNFSITLFSLTGIRILEQQTIVLLRRVLIKEIIYAIDQYD